jgi:dTDP-4-dehydrorhamnose 3,5-epimerase
MDIASLEIEAVKLMRPKRHSDPRGYLVETWNRRTFAEAGIDCDFVQDNCSFSRLLGTIRGLHFQTPPCEQAKLIRVVRGSVFDVAVDLRRSSRTFGRYVSAVLSAEEGAQLFIPTGFAHGFCTLEYDTEVAYKTSDFYSPEHNTGILWNDPELAIDWPLADLAPVLSDKDQRLPLLREIEPSY